MAVEPSTLRFGAFELDVLSLELRKGHTRTRLQEQPFEILRLMLEKPGSVVTREEFRQRLWPDGTFVDFEHSLNAAVKRLRAALGDNAENPRFVETLPRRGYRFIAALADSDRLPRRSAVSGRPMVRLAVLPFDNLSGGALHDYFSDGLTEEMIAQLGCLCRGRIGVLARWSSMVFKGTSKRAREIGEALRVQYLLEGSVRREGDRVRITASLVEAATETHLWSETYERNLSDCLGVQADVAARIARSLAMELVPDEHGRSRHAGPDPAAYQAYLKARYYWNKPGDEGLDQAVAYFEQALAIAPTFVDARAAEARARIAQAEYYRGLPRQHLVSARAAAVEAIERDYTMYEAHHALADATRMLDWDWRAAEASYMQAISLNPSYEAAHRGYGMMLSALSRHREAIRESDRAFELDPLCLVVGTNAAWIRYAAGDYDVAIEHCRNTIDMDAEYLPARRLLAAAYLAAGRQAEALAELESAAALTGADPVVLAWLAHARAVTGSRTEAVQLLARVRALETERYVSHYHLALAHAGLDDADAAFAALDQAWLDRDPVLAFIGVEPRFEPIRNDPRYEGLLARIGIPGSMMIVA